jgi:hypothetical protein
MRLRAVLRKCGSGRAVLLTQEGPGIVGCSVRIQGMTLTGQAMTNVLVAQRLGQRRS